jgi:hypothetical protein
MNEDPGSEELRMENELLAPKDHFSKQPSKEECPSITTQTTQLLTTVTIESKNHT